MFIREIDQKMYNIQHSRITIEVFHREGDKLFKMIIKSRRFDKFLILIDFKKSIIFDERKYINNKS